MTAIKRITLATIALAVALALATVNPASALARTAGPAVPIKSRSSGTYTFDKKDGTLTGEESGVSSQLGKFTVQLQPGSTGTIDKDTGAIHFRGKLIVVAANGDHLTGDFDTTGNLKKQRSVVTITGGTGRFAHATGTIIVDCTTVGEPQETENTVIIERECIGTGTLQF